LSDAILVGQVFLSAFAVAGFACGDEVVKVVGSAGVVLDEVVGFDGWAYLAPMASGVAAE
jgi:hypothetical protein